MKTENLPLRPFHQGPPFATIRDLHQSGCGSTVTRRQFVGGDVHQREIAIKVYLE